MIEDRSWETGEERCAWIRAEEEDYRKDISCKEVGNETRREDCRWIWCLPSCPGFQPLPLPASHLHLQQHLWNRSVSLTFFSLPLLLLFPLQFLKLIVLSATQLAVWKDLFWVSSQCKCSLNEILSMHSLSFQRHRAEAHPKLIALRMTSLCSLLLQVLSLYALANHD